MVIVVGIIHGQDYTFDNQTEITTIGLWIEAFGTFLSAIGNTPIPVINENLLHNIDAIGDVLQVSGTAIQIDDEKYYTLNKYGNIVIAGGTLEEVYANFRPDRGSQTQELLFSQSTAIQAVGTGLALIDSFEQKQTFVGLCEIYANFLQIIGLSIESLSGIYDAENEKGILINSIGHWIQFTGATLAAICQETTDPYFFKKQYKDKSDKYCYSYYLYPYVKES